MKYGTYTFGTTPEQVIRTAFASEIPSGKYHMDLVGEDAHSVIDAVNEGIDSHLTAITDSEFTPSGRRLGCKVTEDDMIVLLRRLGDSGSNEAMSLRSSILQTLEIEEI